MRFSKSAITAIFGAVFFTATAHDACTNRTHRESAHIHNRHVLKHDHHTHNDGAKSQRTVEISGNALKTMGLTTIHPQKRRINSTVTLWGRMELSSDARKEFPSPVAGHLSLKVREFDIVKKGSVLFTVNSPAIKSISHEISVLKSRLQVYRKLKTTNAEIESALKVKISEKAALIAGAEEKDGLVTIRATMDGLVEKLKVADGAWMETGSSVVSIVNMSALRFHASVVSSEASKLHDEMKARISGTEARLRIGVGGLSGMTDVYAIFEGKAPGRAGELAKAECVLDENEKAVLAVPDDCIVKTDAEPMVFIRDHRHTGRFIAVKVSIGASAEGWTQVHGLPEDHHVEIVKNGAYELKLALAAESSTSKTVGHYHADGTFHEEEH